MTKGILKIDDLFTYIDVKLICKALAELLENILPKIISSNQNSYAKDKCISEKGIDHFHNIFRHFNVLRNFPITTSETKRGY